MSVINMILNCLNLFIAYYAIFNPKDKNIFRKHITIFCVTLVLLMLISFFDIPGAYVISEIFYLVFLILCDYSKSLFDRILSGLLTYAIVSAVDIFVVLMYQVTTADKTNVYTYAENKDIIHTVVATIVILITTVVIVRKRFTIKFSITEKIFLLACVTIMDISTVLVIMNLHTGTHIGDSLIRIIPIITMLIIVVLIALIYRGNRMREILSMRENYISILKSYYKGISEKEIEIRSFRHDAKNHFQTIRGLLLKNDSEAALSMVSTIIERESEITNELPTTGDSLTDAILMEKKRLYPNVDFDVTSKMMGRSPINEYDYITIIGNLLDNACEYATKNGMTGISVIINRDNIAFDLKIKNAVSENVDPKFFENNIARKRLGHGIGVKNTRRIVESNGGKLSYNLSDNILTAHVVLRTY